MKNNNLSKLIVLSLLVVAAGLFACQSVSSFFVGRTVSEHLRIPLAENTVQNGTWETFDLVINYSVESRGDKMTISGQTELGEHYQRMYERLNRLEVYLFLLNGESAVLETVQLASALTTRTDQRMDFRKSLPLPAGTRAISFGYRGEATSMDGHSSFDSLDSFNSISFDELP